MVNFSLIIWVWWYIINIRILYFIWIHLLINFFFNNIRLLVSHFISQIILCFILNFFKWITGLCIFYFLLIFLKKHDFFRSHYTLDDIRNILNAFFLNAKETFFLVKFFFYHKSLLKIILYLFFIFFKLLLQNLRIQISI